jgi:DNA repair photolyase
MKGETKEQRFKRIAEKRVQRVLDSIRSLSNSSNKRMYEWKDEQLQKIWTAIDKELQKCKASFENAKPEEFRL